MYLNNYFPQLRKNFLGTKNEFESAMVKWAIGVQAIEL